MAIDKAILDRLEAAFESEVVELEATLYQLRILAQKYEHPVTHLKLTCKLIETSLRAAPDEDLAEFFRTKVLEAAMTKPKVSGES